MNLTAKINRGPVIGYYMDCPISDHYQSEDGAVHDFVGVTQSGLDDLRENQSLLYPGLIYQLRTLSEPS